MECIFPLLKNGLNPCISYCALIKVWENRLRNIADTKSHSLLTPEFIY